MVSNQGIGHNGFRFNTAGCCFLCLKVARTNEQEQTNLSLLTALFNYLGISLGDKSVSEDMKSAEFSKRELRSRSTIVEALLCEECSEVNESILELGRVIEVAQMKISYNVDFIRGKMEEARRTPSRMIRYRQRMGVDKISQSGGEIDFKPNLELKVNSKSDLTTGVPSLDKVDGMRKQLLKKCAEAVLRSKFQPRVKIRKLLRNAHTNSEITSEPPFQESTLEPHISSIIKVEDSEPTSLRIRISRDSSTKQRECQEQKLFSHDEHTRQISAISSEKDTTSYETQNISFPESKNWQKDTPRPRFFRKCRHCHKAFTSKPEIFIAHQNSCTALPESSPVNKVQCPTCGKMFKHAGSLFDHNQTIHLNTQKYKCDQCDRQFSVRRYLLRHKKAVHERIRFHCNFPSCALSYSTNYLLSIHQKSAHFEQYLAARKANSSTSTSVKESRQGTGEHILPN